MKKFVFFIVGLVLSIGVFAQEFLYFTDFQDSTEAIANWTIFSPQNEPGYNFHWHLGVYGGDWWLRASAYDSDTQTDLASEQIAVTPAINVGDATNLILKFKNRKRYGPGLDLEVYYSTDFDGDSTNYSNATWNQFTGITLDESDNDYDFVWSGDLNFTVDANSTVYISFRYTSESGNSCVWDIDSVEVYASGSTEVVAEPISNLYPNPTSDVIYLNVNSKINSVVIINALGQVVKSFNTNNQLLNVADLPAGYYSVIINTEKGIISKKFLKR